MHAKFKAFGIKSRDEFDFVIEHITHEAYRARDNWDFWAAMEKAFHEYAIELNETPAFWELTRRAHKDSVILRLGRLYDPYPGAASLGNLLQSMKENAPGTSAAFRTSLANLDMAELDREISVVSNDDPIVTKLLRIRNEYLDHRGKQHIMKGRFDSLPTFDRDEISTLITRAINLLGKYRERLGYPQVVWGHHEAEEFQMLLSLLRAGRGPKMP